MNEIAACLQRVRALAIDLDGVVYQGDEPLPGACDAVQDLRASGLHVSFVTNNSRRTRLDIAEKLTRLGIPASEGQVFTSGYAAGVFLSRQTDLTTSTILVIGSSGLRTELEKFELRLVDSPPCKFLVVGLDVGFDYQTLSLALDALLQGALLVACNRDARFPVEGNHLMPGCGPIVAAIECAWGERAHYEIGKPSCLLLEMVAEHGDFTPEEILVVGDLAESDIAMANKFGSPSVLVGSGSVFGQNQDEASELRPTLRVKELGELPRLFKSGN